MRILADQTTTLTCDPLLAAGKAFVLSGVAPRPDTTRVPVRGDLAHIRLAGRVFVPHYAVPMAHRVGASGAGLLTLPGGEALGELAPGTPFDLLDMAAGFAWGEVPQAGLVGYVALDRLEKA